MWQYNMLPPSLTAGRGPVTALPAMFRFTRPVSHGPCGKRPEKALSSRNTEWRAMPAHSWGRVPLRRLVVRPSHVSRLRLLQDCRLNAARQEDK